MKNDLHLELSKLVGEPINYQLPVPLPISKIANTDTVEPGEKVYTYEDVDGDSDDVLGVDATGRIFHVEREPLEDVLVPLSGLQSRIERVNVDVLLGRPDLKVLSRKKAGIARAMDKKELKAILTAITTESTVTISSKTQGRTPTSTGVEKVEYASGDDIYDLILKAKQKIEDYGNKYVLLNGSAVQNKIDTYDKDVSATLNYNPNIKAKLAQLGIEEVKVWGKVRDKTADGTDFQSGDSESRLLDTNKFVLVATDSTFAEGKPITFVRRKISPEIAKLMGAEIDKAQRANLALQTPIRDENDKLAIGVYGYESICFVISNPKAIVFCDAESAL